MMNSNLNEKENLSIIEKLHKAVQFGSKNSGGGTGGDYSKPAPKESSNEKVQLEDNLGTIDYGDSINPEDIPF
jgi:hypothetical protein